MSCLHDRAITDREQQQIRQRRVRARAPYGIQQVRADVHLIVALCNSTIAHRKDVLQRNNVLQPHPDLARRLTLGPSSSITQSVPFKTRGA